MNFSTQKCKYCGKPKDDHLGKKGLNCPVGDKTKTGYTMYRPNRVFEPLKKEKD